MTKILLVEDNEMNQDMLTRRLRRRGYEVVCAMDGQTGVDLARSETPDLILMDMSLPIMDGWAATTILKADAQTRSIPIIALTAHAMVGDRQKSMDAGCDDYDTKPVELARLLSKVEILLATGVADKSPDEEMMIGAMIVPAPAAIAQPPVSPSATIRAVDPTAATILIIDDNEMNRDMLGRRLERAGYQAILAEGGRQGLELIEQQPIDLVLLDIMMPDFNGIETLTAIRAKYTMAQLPIIMATAKDRSEDMLQAFDLGANDYVVKPIDLPVVLARIQSHLRLIQSASQSSQPILTSQPELKIALEPIAQPISQPILNNTTPEIVRSETIEPASKLLLGRYKISQQLVRDDFQDIYLAQDTRQDRQPTCLVRRIKLNRERPSLSVAAIQHFKQEIEVFKQLSQSQNIVSILDTFQQEQQLFLIHTYIGKDLLSNKLKSERSAGIAIALTTFVEMLEILHKLHQYKISHRHLDASCFAYDLDNRLVLIDLGIESRLSAKLQQLTNSDLAIDRTESSNIYQMPAQWNEGISESLMEEIAPSLDIYNIGTIVLHALTGISPDRLPVDLVTGQIKWQDSCIVSTSLATIINKTISRNPEDRYNSIDTILKDLYQLPMVSTVVKRSQILVSN